MGKKKVRSVHSKIGARKRRKNPPSRSAPRARNPQASKYAARNSKPKRKVSSKRRTLRASTRKSSRKTARLISRPKKTFQLAQEYKKEIAKYEFTKGKKPVASKKLVASLVKEKLRESKTKFSKTPTDRMTLKIKLRHQGKARTNHESGDIKRGDKYWKEVTYSVDYKPGDDPEKALEKAIKRLMDDADVGKEKYHWVNFDTDPPKVHTFKIQNANKLLTGITIEKTRISPETPSRKKR